MVSKIRRQVILKTHSTFSSGELKLFVMCKIDEQNATGHLGGSGNLGLVFHTFGCSN